MADTEEIQPEEIQQDAVPDGGPAAVVVEDGGEETVDEINDENVPYILRSYFKIVSKIVDGKATGKCLHCVGSAEKNFSATLRATTNLTGHLVRLSGAHKTYTISNYLFLKTCRN